MLEAYWLWGALGFTVGGAWALRNLVALRVPFPVAVLALTLAVYAGLFGTRLLFVAAHAPQLFRADPDLAIAFWQGGLAWFGGLLPGAAAFALVLRLARLPVWPGLGALAAPLALAHAIARVGCWLRGCCHGLPTDLPWGMFHPLHGERLHPTQFYSAGVELLVAALLHTLWVRYPAQRRLLFPLYALLLGAHRFVTEAWRATPDGPELIPGLRFYQVVALLAMLAAALALLTLWRPRLGVRIGLAVSLALSALLAWAHPQPTAHTPALIVAAPALAPALAPDQAHLIARPGASAAQLLARLRAHQPPPDAVLLLGDWAPDCDAPHCLPAFALPHDGERAYTDAFYGDLDADGVVETPVGRLPVRTAAAARAYLQRVHRLRSRALPPRLAYWGAPELDGQPVAPPLPESALGYRVRAVVPAPPLGPSLAQTLALPAALQVWVAHGSPVSVSATPDAPATAAFTLADVQRIPLDGAAAPLLIAGCDAAAYTGEAPCLAEALLAAPAGPGAVIAATATTYPLTNYLLLRAAAARPVADIGALWVRLQQPPTLPAEDPLATALAALNPSGGVEPTRLANEPRLYALLGDPTLPLPNPALTQNGSTDTSHTRGDEP